MGNCLSKFNNDKSLIIIPGRPLASGHLKQLLRGVRKKSVKYIVSVVHQEYGYQKITQSIKSSLMDVYDRFPLQSFELLDGGTQFIKTSKSFGFEMGVLNSLKSSVIKK